MKYCPKCRDMMTLKQLGENLYYVCKTCGYKEPYDQSDLYVDVTREERVLVLQKDTTAEPVVKVECPKCGNEEAYTWIVQTRSGDEGGTVFYRCTRCKYTWRIYT